MAETWVIPHLGGVRASALTPKMVVDWIDTLRTTQTARGRAGLSPRSVQLATTVLKGAYKFGCANGLLGTNPIASVKAPRAVSPEMKFWTAEQARQFLAATAGDRLAWAWALLLTRGPRRGEVCGLKWHDLDLDAGTWRVTWARIVVDGKAIDSIPKTTAGRRVVPLDANLVAKLRAYRAVQLREKLAAGPAYDDSGWLFCDELGVPYYPDSLSTWFDRRVKALDLPRIRLHDTRHTAASLMLAAGTPARVVGALIGHASPNVTLAIYGHLMPGATEEAGTALSASLLG